MRLYPFKLIRLIRKLHFCRAAIALMLAIVLFSCRNNTDSAGSWKTYQNDRFGFEFLYPEQWVASIPPETRDGMAFSDPKNPNVEIRGWANYARSNSGTNLPQQSKLPQKPMPPNFTTQQGITGNLEVKINPKVSSMTITLLKNNILYYWQGSAPNQQFDAYYRFFYYIASRYRILV